MTPTEPPPFQNTHILIVDDDSAIRELLEQAVLIFGLKCSTAENGVEALQVMAALREAKQTDVDAVVTDINMPKLDGIGLLAAIKRDGYTSDVVVMTGAVEAYSYDKIVAMGASDFIRKPVGIKEFMVRLKRVLRERHLKADLQRANQELKTANASLRELHRDLQDSYVETIRCLVLAAEYKDEDTGDHIVRISRYSAYLAEQLGLSTPEVQNILYASPMHDIGKIGIPDNIILKPGKLTPEEFAVVKTHTTIGAAILERSKSEIIKLAREIALHHHEKWDGSGYPDGLAGEQIHVAARIVGLVDVFDALTSARPYKDAYPLDVAASIIEDGRGKHFDPDLVDIFTANLDKIWEIRKEITAIEDLSSIQFDLSERDQLAGVAQPPRTANEEMVVVALKSPSSSKRAR